MWDVYKKQVNHLGNTWKPLKDLQQIICTEFVDMWTAFRLRMDQL